MAARFIHLHVHTEFSIVDGLVAVGSLVNAAVKLGMPAIAVTEQTNLFSTVKFYRAAQEHGVKPIIGAEMRVFNETNSEYPSSLVLLCQDLVGYRNLTKLLTRSYTDGQFNGRPFVHRHWFREHGDGLIALSGGCDGDIGHAIARGNVKKARRLVSEWKELFPDRYYIELQRIGQRGEDDYIRAVVELALNEDIPVLATNNVRFLDADDFEAHEARVCIQEGRTLADLRRPRRYTAQQYLRTPEEMAELFTDIPEAIDNTLAVAQRCNLELGLNEYHLPDFPVPEGYSQEDWLCRQALEGMERCLASRFDVDAPGFRQVRETYFARLQSELDVVTSMGFAGYFLIVADFVRWAKDHGIPVGPGRGSGAGSLAAYALGITELDPIQYDLLFERFLNPQRVSLPDFDVDFCMDRRDEVIEYVANRYGRDRVSQIITFGTMAAKAVVRDVGRVLGYAYGFVDQIAKLIPFDLNMTLDRALSEEEGLRRRYAEDEEVRVLIDLARKLEGLTRNAGKHAGGIVIAPSALTDYMPLYCERGANSAVTQFDMGDVEAIGLVKFDFLGLRTLTIIDWAVRDINRLRKEAGEDALDIARVPLDDPKTFDLIMGGETTAIFQLESRGMKELIKRLQPDVFEDLIALVALFRPGPLQSGMVEDFIARKHGRAQVEYLHPGLATLLKLTYGVILYQEQVMQIAQVLAGYSLGAADLLRRAMGKKKPEEMAKQREVFIEGAMSHGIERPKASWIFDIMEKFAGYGFNKSHSAAYALIAYQTAWLKAHYPAAFMAAVLSSDMDNTDKVVTLIDECRRMQLKVLPPDVNVCRYAFMVVDLSTIGYGLGAIKGAGKAAIDHIVEERDRHGPYRDLFDFCRRIDSKRANRRTVEALIRAGALDGLGPGRSVMMASLDNAFQIADKFVKDHASGQNDLFGLNAESDVIHKGENEVPVPSRFVIVPEWSDTERLAGEKETLGLYLTGHPIDRYEAELGAITTSRLVELKLMPNHNVVVAGLVMALRTRNSRRGRIAFVSLDDRTARMELTVYSDVFQQYRNLLVKDRLLVIEGSVGVNDDSGHYSITANKIYDIDQARATFAKCLLIRIQADSADNGIIRELKDILTPFKEGRCPVSIHYLNSRAEADVRLGEQWRVILTDELLEALKTSFGEHSIHVEY
ncbi:MAG: DNA polymerase III subunit alpha [Gammaproteobacteria bacterium]|nr:DNA polymerase III subunit alpha [Gammaproteobacteria bacterium]MCI0591642.1 DNA polymerase III subunit alpha [Gammaproteobacteria bacterium]